MTSEASLALSGLQGPPLENGEAYPMPGPKLWGAYGVPPLATEEADPAKGTGVDFAPE